MTQPSTEPGVARDPSTGTSSEAGSAVPVAISERVHLPLLTLITQQSLDEDYLVAAERRAAGAPRRPSGRARRTAAVVIAAFGILVSTAFVQTTRNADVQDAGRATLIERLEIQRTRLASQLERAADLRAGNLESEAALSELADTEQAALVRNRRLQVRTGFLRVAGPGVRVTVTDRPGADPVQQVQDADLAMLVNGLWEGGAEAIAVNGQRLTGRSAIGSSGLAIEVNGVGIAGPYTVEAIGDTRTLSARLFDTTTGLGFVASAERYGFTYVVDNVGNLSLPPGPSDLLTQRSASTDMTDAPIEGQPPPKPTQAPDTPDEPDPDTTENPESEDTTS